MPQSSIKPTYEFDSENWLITLVNTKGILDGHAVIIVEGITSSNQIFHGEYDITSAAFPEEQTWSQSTLGNTLGYITKIRCTPHYNERSNLQETASFHRDYKKMSELSKRSWRAPCAKVLDMIEKIEVEAKTLDDEVRLAQYEQRDVNWPYKYQKAGSQRLTILGGNEAESCITWAEKHLEVAGVGNGKFLADSSKAIPALHTACSML